MTYIGFVSLAIGLLASLLLITNKSFSNVRVFPPAFYLWHTAACLLGWYISLSDFDPDSRKYFSLAPYDMPFGIATNLVYWFTSATHKLFSGFGPAPTYLDYFLIFNLFGYAGCIVLCATMLEKVRSFGARTNTLVVLAMLIPGLSFWTSALGKDAPIFLGIALMVRGASDLKARLWLFVLGLALVFLIRPHVGIIAVVAAGVPLLLDKRISIQIRTAASIIALGSGLILLPVVMSIAGINSFDIATISDYVSERQGYNIEGAGGVDISQYHPVFRVFTYLFRPLFIDAQGFLGLVLSFENLFLFALCGLALTARQKYWRVAIRKPEVLFHLVFFLSTLLLFSQTTSNLGIAARQKMMIIPSLYMIMLALLQERHRYNLRMAGAAQRNRPGRPVLRTVPRNRILR